MPGREFDLTGPHRARTRVPSFIDWNKDDLIVCKTELKSPNEARVAIAGQFDGGFGPGEVHTAVDLNTVESKRAAIAVPALTVKDPCQTHTY